MKTRLATGLAVFMALGGVFSYAWAQDETARDIQSLFDGAAASFDKKDVDGIASSALPEATLRFLDRTTMSLEQWKENAKKEFADMDSMRSEFKVEKAQVEGNTALAQYTETHEYVLTSEKDHQYLSVSRWSATLAKTPQGWRAKRFVQLSQKITRDGMPFTPTAAAKKPRL